MYLVHFARQAVLKALREREAQLLTVQALEADIAKKHKALGVLDEQVHQYHCPFLKQPQTIPGLGIPPRMPVCCNSE